MTFSVVYNAIRQQVIKLMRQVFMQILITHKSVKVGDKVGLLAWEHFLLLTHICLHQSV